jgi:hypothetical protein
MIRPVRNTIPSPAPKVSLLWFATGCLRAFKFARVGFMKPPAMSNGYYWGYAIITWVRMNL